MVVVGGSSLLPVILRTIGYIVLFAILAGIVTVIATTYLSAQHAGGAVEAQDVASHMFSAVMDRVRGRGGGRVVGGANPPSLADLLTLPSSRHMVTAAQEVVMTGEVSSESVAASGPNNGACLGGDKEALLQIKNDVGADQLDVSYYISNDPSTRVIKVASCGADSSIRQCLPIMSESIILQLLAIYYDLETVPATTEGGSEKTISIVREKRLTHHQPLKIVENMELNASAFTVDAEESPVESS